MVLWYIFPRFGSLCEEKSGSPVALPEMKSAGIFFRRRGNERRTNFGDDNLARKLQQLS
jgi:hypothetical protein